VIDLKSIVEEVAGATGARGLSAAVAVGDQVVAHATGSANPERDLPMTTETLVQIGSTTKVLNAVLVLRLAELGLLQLETPVRELVPGFRLADEEATETLTLWHLLSMSSGLDNGPYAEYGFDDGCVRDYAAGLAEVPQLFPPGAGYAYSNAGSVVAGHVAEVRGGARWDELLRTHVLDPAGMAYTETLTDRLLFQRVAVGIAADGSVARPWYWTRSMGPAGSTCAATPTDLTRFARIFLGDGAGVLSAESVATMTAPTVDVPTRMYAAQWCLGPQRDDRGSHAILGHWGGNTAGSSVLWWLPELDATIACVTNGVGAIQALEDCAVAAARALGCEPPPVRPAPEEAALDPAIPGTYDRHDMRYDVEAEGDAFTLRARGKGPVFGSVDRTTQLVAAGPDRFLLDSPLGQGLPSPVAFPVYAGRRVLVDGVFGARRVE
jgi:CubicO group peptidase (beta-lactamase class C family)